MPGMNTYTYSGGELDVTCDMKKDFARDGFIIVRSLLSRQELDIIEEAVNGPDSLTTYAYGNNDSEGKAARMCLWNHAGRDSTGILARMRKLAHTAEELLGGEVYHYHSKLMMKDAYTGGRFEWHQDYGYWYNFACLFPDMMTAFVALDPCDLDNGCLHILRGSHRCGRIQHGVVGGQMGADVDRVRELEERLERVAVKLDPGDTLFFHCNLLHTSSSNSSPRRRWAILSCYNRVHNSPYAKIVHGPYKPLEQLDNNQLLSTGVSRDFTGKEVLVKKDGKMTAYFM